MEILSDILKTLRVDGSVYFCDHVEYPWTKEFIDTSTASFHLVRQGSCWIKVGDKIERLNSGDLVFLGPEVDHILTSTSPLNNTELLNDSTLLLCGYCSFEQDTLTPLKDIFSELTIVREQELIKHPWLKSTFDQLSSEYMAQNPGNEIIVNKLTEVVLVELIRINFGRKKQNSFLLALNDKRISNALQLMHETPHEPWTIEILANKIGMSRAAFAKKFHELVGQTMFSYLSQLRVQKAKHQLLNTNLRVDDIALNIGYESERAFTKTFGKYVGMTPKQYRKNN
ncbi:MAG: AraC family transcriptional regulator [Colwelliaceae bacterium]|nr:AraC family transcriptional regulator [Colwelliaceae bacterium]